MPVKKVWYHKSFQSGNFNNDFFVDEQYLSDEQLEVITDFIFDILSGEPLHGRNKPSWLNRFGEEIQKSASYKSANVWHYHAGPHNKALPLTTPNVRAMNLGQQTSGAVIHYTWRGNETEEVIILGFSPTHKDFPFPSDRGSAIRTRFNNFRLYPAGVLVDPLENNDE